MAKSADVRKCNLKFI